MYPTYYNGQKLSAKVSLLLENVDENGIVREKQSFRTDRAIEAVELMKLTIKMFIRLAKENNVSEEQILDALKFNISNAIVTEMGKPKIQQKLPVQEVIR